MTYQQRKSSSFKAKQKLPYEAKKNYAYKRAWEYYEECGKRGLNCHVTVGGLDSITLYIYLDSIGIRVPGISVSITSNIWRDCKRPGRHAAHHKSTEDRVLNVRIRDPLGETSSPI